MVCAAATAASADGVKLEVLSSRPELITGSTALVRITGTSEVPPAYASNDTLIAPMFADGAGGWIGIIPELNEAENKLYALPNFHSAGPETEVRVESHPVNGPLFSGPQTMPFRCDNQAHGLPQPTDAGCTAPLVVEYYYRSADRGWQPLNPGLAGPTDLQTTKTSDGRTVPLIVRVEKGIANRAAYAIAVLDDPSARTPTPWNHAASGWNGKLVYAFGGGVGYDDHAMGTAIGFLDPKQGYVGGENAGLYEAIIRAGYAIASASLNVTGITANDVVQAETLEKVKERFIKRYGPPIFTIGIGKDGGALPLYLIAQDYPGLLDAEFAIGGYADPVEFQSAVNDCALLNRYFAATKLAWRDSSKHAVLGYSTVCDTLPGSGPTPCPNAPTCALEDDLVNLLGRDPQSGRARGLWDNVGVQYGLVAFNLGLISEDQFIELNATIGGRRPDGSLAPVRTVGDADAIRTAYASGRVLTGGGSLADTAILNVRLYPGENCDDPPCAPDPATVTPGYGDRTLAIRTRIEYATTSPGNYAEFIFADRAKDTGPDGATAKLLGASLSLLDKWLMDVRADTSAATRQERIVTYRPAALRDTCVADIGGAITERRACDALFPPAQEPRVAAGAPLSDDVLKCQLKPVDAADYPATIGPDFLARVRQVFPAGVCDYAKPGVGQVPLAGTWLAYAADGKFAESALP
jgi:hypothetical protein